MALVYEDGCGVVGVDPAKVLRLARRLESCGKEAKALGLTIFGGSGSGSLRAPSPSIKQLGDRPYVVADFSSPFVWDGGDGATTPDEAGILRGEGTS